MQEWLNTGCTARLRMDMVEMTNEKIVVDADEMCVTETAGATEIQKEPEHPQGEGRDGVQMNQMRFDAQLDLSIRGNVLWCRHG